MEEFCKLLNNAFHGKTIENERNQMKIKSITDKKIH